MHFSSTAYIYFFYGALNAEEYIKIIQPDYVLVLYYDVTSLKNSNGKYDFYNPV